MTSQPKIILRSSSDLVAWDKQQKNTLLKFGPPGGAIITPAMMPLNNGNLSGYAKILRLTAATYIAGFTRDRF